MKPSWYHQAFCASRCKRAASRASRLCLTMCHVWSVTMLGIANAKIRPKSTSITNLRTAIQYPTHYDLFCNISHLTWNRWNRLTKIAFQFMQYLESGDCRNPRKPCITYRHVWHIDLWIPFGSWLSFFASFRSSQTIILDVHFPRKRWKRSSNIETLASILSKSSWVGESNKTSVKRGRRVFWFNQFDH